MIAVTYVLILLSACAWSIGDKAHECPPQPIQPTLGQELIDLKMAKDQGVITEEEYQAQKRKLMEKQ
jgi:hypothetical protein